MALVPRKHANPACALMRTIQDLQRHRELRKHAMRLAALVGERFVNHMATRVALPGYSGLTRIPT